MRILHKDLPHALDLRPFSDDRGCFQILVDGDMMLYTDQEELTPIKRSYYVANHSKNVVRGFHYHEREMKIFTAIKGAFKIIALQPYNPKLMHTFVVSERAPKLVVIPPTWANGNMSLEDNSILLAFSTSTTEESKADDVRYDPYKWGNTWTVKGR